MRWRSKQYIVFSVLLCALVFLAGFYTGSGGHVRADGNQIGNGDFSEFWKVWNVIDQKYPDASEVSMQSRITGATKGLVESLGDPYSEFFDKEETKNFNETIEGSFGGVGLEIDEKEGVISVIAPLKNTPADKAGIEPGDIILKINDESTENMSVEDAIKKIRGDVGTSVALTLLGKDAKTSREVKLVRDTISVPTLETKKIDDGIFNIALYNFDANSATDFKKAIVEFQKSGNSKLILDLRGNPGGYLDAAIDMASWFVPKGKTIVTENYGEKKSETVHKSKGYSLGVKNLKVVVLIDGGSASASEILAGALQDYKLATLVGTQSYGKGSVQEVIDISDAEILKLTVAKWLTPNKNWISKKGLTPDVVLENKNPPKEAGDKDDLQFKKAVELLNK